MASSARLEEAAARALEGLTAGVLAIGSDQFMRHVVHAAHDHRSRIDGLIVSERAIAERARKAGFRLMEFEDGHAPELFLTGVSEITRNRHCSVCSAAPLRDKVLASMARRMVCIASSAQLTPVLGDRPIAIEVVPSALSSVARGLAALGAHPKPRAGFETPDHNGIIDVRALDLMVPPEAEGRIKLVPGVIEVALHARRTPDEILIVDAKSVKGLGPPPFPPAS